MNIPAVDKRLSMIHHDRCAYVLEIGIPAIKPIPVRCECFESLYNSEIIEHGLKYSNSSFRMLHVTCLLNYYGSMMIPIAV